jgi:hypothetical protein
MPMDDDLDEEAIKKNSVTIASQAQALKVVDHETYERMAEFVLTLRKMVKYFEDLYRPRIKQADEVTKGLRADMRRLQEPAIHAQEYGDRELAAYDRLQANIAEEKRLKEQAEKDEREKAEREELAKLLTELGQKDSAADVLAAPSEDPPVFIPKDTPRVPGLTYRDDWKFEIIDSAALPREYLIPDEIKIGRVVRALKGTTNIPGVRVYSVRVAIGRPI